MKIIQLDEGSMSEQFINSPKEIISLFKPYGNKVDLGMIKLKGLKSSDIELNELGLIYDKNNRDLYKGICSIKGRKIYGKMVVMDMSGKDLNTDKVKPFLESSMEYLPFKKKCKVLTVGESGDLELGFFSSVDEIFATLTDKTDNGYELNMEVLLQPSDNEYIFLSYKEDEDASFEYKVSDGVNCMEVNGTFVVFKVKQLGDGTYSLLDLKGTEISVLHDMFFRTAEVGQ